jgi:Reverse transcriptase (RNA-dependent DNA polymerase)
VAHRFGFDNTRYSEFYYLCYLDIYDPYVVNYVQYQCGTAKPKIKGRLSQHIRYWATLHTPDWLMDIIAYGVKVPFLSEPPRIFLTNNKSAVQSQNVDWVRSTITEYIDYGFILPVDTVPHCVMPLQVKTGTTKNSLIYDMTAMNAYVDTNKFSLESWPEMIAYARTAEFGIKFDLKKYYHEIDLHPDFFKYFGFSYVLEDNADPQFFVWTTLPFGYNRAPYIARSIMKPLISKWRSLGAQCVIFYDDGMCVHNDKILLRKLALQIQCDLLRAGLLPGIEKCVWEPVPVLDWNGLRFDFGAGGIAILPDRIDKLFEQLNELLHQWPDVTYRDLARLVGRIMSMAPVFGGLVQIRTKMSQTFVNIRHFNEYDWDTKIFSNFGPLYTETFAEFLFWKDYIHSNNFTSFRHKAIHWTGWTDASSHAVAGIALEHEGPTFIGPLTADNLLINPQTNKFVLNYYKRLNTEILPWSGIQNMVRRDRFDVDPAQVANLKIVRRSLTEREKKTDSNERELLAIVHLLQSLLPKFRGKSVKLHVDNANAADIIMTGSNKPRLHFYARLVSDLCVQNDIVLDVSWIPRSLNNVADIVSKTYDGESYSVTDSFYHTVVQDFGQVPNLDPLADNTNCKTPRFFSKLPCPHTLGVDAFQYYWGPPNICWLFPPPKMVVKVLTKLQFDKGEGLLLIPQWKNAHFYPSLRGLALKYVIKKLSYDGSNIFLPGDDPTSFFGPMYKGNVEVWHLKFSAL